MKPLRDFLSEIDARWKPVGGEPLPLELVGSAALMLQADYARGTKDGDVLESRDGSLAIKKQLIALAGNGTEMHKRFGLYIDVVNRAIMFLPQRPVFHPLPDLRLKNFKAAVLDVNDVVLSKIKRLNSDDLSDIRAMADMGLLDHRVLVQRFKAAVDRFTIDARALDVPLYLKNLHRVERDLLNVPLSPIQLPPECDPE